MPGKAIITSRTLAMLAALAAGTCLSGNAAPARAERPTLERAAASSTLAARRPNIVLILADDFGVEGVNAYGGEYHTPNIDALAREGVRFDNAHAMPLCTPSRTRIMTGRENHRNYQAFGHLAPGETTFGNVLKRAGYATGIVGKWQLSGNGFDGRTGITLQDAGFDESYLWQLQVRDAKGSRYWGPTRSVNGRTVIREEGFGPDADLAAALDFIDRHKDGPFLLYLPLVLVHDPFVPTPASLDARSPKERFAAMVAYMDRQVGQITDRLKSLGLDRDTVVIFTGDNGTNRKITTYRNGHPITGDKGAPTLNGTHVPLIIRAPGIAGPGTVAEGLFDLTDVLPTLAELAGTELPSGASDGFSQVDVMAGRKRSVRDSIFMHYAPRWTFEPARLAFDERWKLYGNGRFVALDPLRGTETEVPVTSLRGSAKKRHAALQRILDHANDGPLDPDRYPMCDGRPSREPSIPAIRAGCEGVGGD